MCVCVCCFVVSFVLLASMMLFLSWLFLLCLLWVAFVFGHVFPCAVSSERFACFCFRVCVCVCVRLACLLCFFGLIALACVFVWFVLFSCCCFSCLCVLLCVLLCFVLCSFN